MNIFHSKRYLYLFIAALSINFLAIGCKKSCRRRTTSFPNIPEKHHSEALLTPKIQSEFQKEAGRYPTRKAPETLIMCFNDKVLSGALSKRKFSSYFGVNFLDDNPSVAITSFGMTAPINAMRLDRVIEWGVKRVIAIGSACSLQKYVKPGDIVVCNKAIRDEGTSHHYLPYSKYAYPSKALFDKLIHTLKDMKLKYIVGPTVTTDGFYRFTKKEAQEYQKEGVLTVEMEAAALFAVAQFRNIEIVALFTPTDSYANFTWEKARGYEKTKLKTLDTLFEVALKLATT